MQNIIVTAREEMWTIPTYPVGPADTTPLFYQGRHYQGARGRMYPYPMLDRLSDRIEDRQYKVVILENRYIQVVVLPELGGRIFAAQDKTNSYDFFYRQHVIKPALIGMVGAWISGGAEWNFPHHHRCSTYMPVDYQMLQNPDGSLSYQMMEIERRHHMQWLLGITLHPDQSVIQLDIKINNRTPIAQSFLYFTNAAVHVNNQYQIIFPPSTQFGTQHAKSEFVHWPIGHETYAGVDYTDVDISWWKNHPSPVSIFAWNEDDGFFGGSDHSRDAGTVHTAQPEEWPGKKFFEFGNGPAGRMWDTVLTDNDGPYVELMAGAWSDNQPDYSWIEPFEAKETSSFWYPVHGIGGFKCANKVAAVNLEMKGRIATISGITTREIQNCTVTLLGGEESLHSSIATIAPDRPFHFECELPSDTREDELKLTLTQQDGETVIEFNSKRSPEISMPAAVTPPQSPKEIATIEELVFAGMRLEQFHNPAIDAQPYYREALLRDPGDSRANTALGVLLLKKGLYEEAVPLLRAAVARIIHHYTRPKDAEPLYYLALALRKINDTMEAKKLLLKTTQCQNLRKPAILQLAEINMAEGEPQAALTRLREMLPPMAIDISAGLLATKCYRKLGLNEEAEILLDNLNIASPMDYRIQAERVLLDTDNKEPLPAIFRSDMNVCLEVALEYLNCGAYDDACHLLIRIEKDADVPVNPLLYYLHAYCAELSCDSVGARKLYISGKHANPDYCFPAQLEIEPALEKAIKNDPTDARAPYYLGCLLYDKQPERAIGYWETAKKLDPTFALTHHCLATGYTYNRNDTRSALECMEHAIRLNPTNARGYAEWDNLMETEGLSAHQRLARLEKHLPRVMERDESVLRLLPLYLVANREEEAIDILDNRRFHIWEGSEAAVHRLYSAAHIQRGCTLLLERETKLALEHFLKAALYPANLEYGEPTDGGRIAETSYRTGQALEILGDSKAAVDAYRLAVRSERRTSDLAYFQAMSWRKLGEAAQANEILNELLNYGQERLNMKEAAGFFEKFGSRQSDSMRKADTHTLVGLAHLGLGNIELARDAFIQALNLHPTHYAAWNMIRECAIKGE